MCTGIRLRAVLIATAALGVLALPTVAAFTDTADLAHRPPPDAPHRTPREEIQPAANIAGEAARRAAQRLLGGSATPLAEQAEAPPCHAPAPVPVGDV
ncbi:hypothetical protein DY218_06395 [Streptomyces triticagri]|uniref:Uncharacterized protein n=1 Tax=Streptomyces triticagri TaxID=2293568 RepID=A0A372M9N9_9ACTN|nr:hypothetical protein [Streptomyces triticagri]RFU87579.1 hypothetical protein DY218_06395 [Streptomyces triticagri]